MAFRPTAELMDLPTAAAGRTLAPKFGNLAGFVNTSRRDTSDNGNELVIYPASILCGAAPLSLKSRPWLGAVQDAHDEDYVAVHRVHDQVR